MRIVCPKCEFVREVPDDKIPATAELATCPKCKHKFKFRDISQPAEPEEPVVTASVVDEGTVDYVAPREEQPSEAAPPAPPQPEPAQQAAGEDEEEMEDNTSRWAPLKDQRAESREDIWDRLESLDGPSGNAASPSPPNAEATETGRSQESMAGPAPGTIERDDETTVEVPWERLDQWGFFQGLFQTIKRAMLQAPDFFHYMPLGRGLVKPLIFYILITEVQAVFQYAWHTMLFSATPQVAGEGMGVNPMALVGINSAVMLIVLPILAAIGIFVSTGITHLLLMLFRATDGGFEGTFRAVSYGSSPRILGIIPLVGPWVGWIWGIVVTIIACKHVHRASYWAAIFAILLPLVLLVMAIAAVLFAAIMAGTGAVM